MNVLSESDKVVYEDEVWKPCPDFESKYLISNYGRIKSIGNTNSCKRIGFIKLHKKNGRNGYMQVRLYDHPKAKTIVVHTLVAKAFVPNPNNLPMVNHKDENKTNNYYKNLEWCDNVYNIRYSRAKSVDVYTKDGSFVETIDVMADVSIKYGVPTKYISRCCKSQHGTCNGFQFRYHGEPFCPKPVSLKKEKPYKKHKGAHERSYYFKSVVEYNISGEFIKEWESISSVSKEYSIPTSNISKCCKGSILSIHGMVFLYKNSDILERIKMLNKRKHKSKTENVR